jgi:hypothetical protein
VTLVTETELSAPTRGSRRFVAPLGVNLATATFLETVRLEWIESAIEWLFSATCPYSRFWPNKDISE